MGAQVLLFRVISLFFKHFHMGRIFWIFHMGRYFSLKVQSNTFLTHIRNWKSVHSRLRYDFLKMTMFVKNHVFRPFWVDGGSDWWPFLKILSMQKLFFMVIEQTLKFSLESENFFFRWHFIKKYAQMLFQVFMRKFGSGIEFFRETFCWSF